jgi:hypothetical protein
LIGRRGALVWATSSLFAPTIIRTPGLIMPISILALPGYMLLRCYGYDNSGRLALVSTMTLDDFDFDKGKTRRPSAVTQDMQIWRATLEPHRHSRAHDGREYPLTTASPRCYTKGQLLGVQGFDFGRDI